MRKKNLLFKIIPFLLVRSRNTDGKHIGALASDCHSSAPDKISWQVSDKTKLIPII